MCMNKYKILSVSLLLMILAVCVSSFSGKKNLAGNGIDFIEQDWNKALSTAKNTNKLVFIDIYATWCGPCKMLKNKTFADKKVAEFFNQNFVNVSVDAEKGVGIELSNKYAVSAYPTLVFTDSKGNPVLYSVGYMSGSELMAFAKAALKKAEKK